ncbi:MAG: NADP-dependent oxidoreductase [Nitrospirae bacterium]|nr:NADP-dependent oxidoreductase [Nitrospirota bacterium]
MKAIAFNQYGPPEVLREVNLTVPQPGVDEVLVKVHATSVNPIDWKIRSRQLKIKRPGFPQILGFDLSGVVAGTGADVTDLKPGDPVFGLVNYTRDGCNAQYVRVPALYLRPKPESLSHEQAAALPMAGLSALQALRLHGGLKTGERVLIVGAAGGIGTVAVQVAKAFGAHVTALCDAGAADLVRGLGADAILPRGEDIPQGTSFDLFLDTPKAFDFAHASPFLARGGRYVGTYPDPLGLARARLLWLVGGRKRCLHFFVQPDPQALDWLRRAVAEGTLRPVVAATFPVTELAKAHAAAEAGGLHGRITVQVDPLLD